MNLPRNNGVDADGATACDYRGRANQGGARLRYIAQTEADHFVKCPGCDRWLDMRDLGQVLEHAHGAEIEIIEIDGPPPREETTH